MLLLYLYFSPLLLFFLLFIYSFFESDTKDSKEEGEVKRKNERSKFSSQGKEQEKFNGKKGKEVKVKRMFVGKENEEERERRMEGGGGNVDVKRKEEM